MPKTLMLMRHGQYTSGTTCLNDVGKEQADDVATQLAAAKVIPDVIVHSETPRAIETAKRVRDVFNSVCGKVITLCPRPGLSVECETSSLADITDVIDNAAQTILVVSHQPNITKILTGMYGKAAALSPNHAQIYVLQDNTPEWSAFHGRVVAQCGPKTLSR